MAWLSDLNLYEGEDWWYEMSGRSIGDPVVLAFRDRRSAILFHLTFCQYDYI